MFKKREIETETKSGAPVNLIPARIYTSAGWIVGKLHVTPDWHLVDFLDHTEDYILLADVILEGRPKVIPLFTLQRSAISFLVLETEEGVDTDTGPRNVVEHPVSCLLQNGTLYGRLHIMKGTRLSHYLSRHKGFVLVKDCHFRLQNPWDDSGIDHRESTVLLNPEAVIGVSDFAQDE